MEPISRETPSGRSCADASRRVLASENIWPCNIKDKTQKIVMSGIISQIMGSKI